MNIVFFVFDGMDALDVVGPYDVLVRMPGAVATFVGPARGTVRTDNNVVGLSADAAIDEIAVCDLLIVPGGFAGLTLAAELAGRDVAVAIQLGLEYDPKPPFDAGDAARPGPSCATWSGRTCTRATRRSPPSGHELARDPRPPG
jgi:hypothetical protein